MSDSVDEIFAAVVAKVGDAERPPASAAALDAAESAVGRAMPPLLRRLYGELANGGFGPEYGIYTVEWAVSAFTTRASSNDWPMDELPASLVPLSSWGCGIETYVDWGDPAGQVWGFDPNEQGGPSLPLHKQEFVLAEWLALWLDGHLRQPWVIHDPTTDLWRCATNAETDAVLRETY